MRILFFIDSLNAGGKERRLTELLKGLKLQKEIEFELIVMNSEIHYKAVYDLDIKIHFLIRKSKKDFSVFGTLYNLCKNIKPDILHCWDSMTAIYSVPVCKLLHIKLINGMVIDTPTKRNISNKYWLRAKLTFLFSDFIVGNSESGLKAYGAPPEKSICIYNGIDSSRFKQLKEKSLVKKEIISGNPENISILGMVASFGITKDYETLIKTAIDLESERSDIRFVLVGDGANLQKMKQMVPDTLLDKIIFLGRRSDIESIVNIFDIGILLTNAKVQFEGISNSILEYMSLGKPVIATRGGGTDEVVRNNWNGLLIDPCNKDQFKESIRKLIGNKELIEELGKRGKELIGEKFDIDIMTEKYILLYKQIIETNK